MGMPYLVGERGPELFVPSTSGAVVANGSGGGGDVVLQLDAQTFARISRDALLKLKASRGGTLGLS
jgi:phage-related minor tail protein